MPWKLLEKILGSVPKLNDDDIVVFVVGPSGSGKSTFVSAVTQDRERVEIGENLQPRTAKVQAIKCLLTEEARTTLRAGERKNIVFVDTPSLLTGVNDGAEKEMTTWLKGSVSRSPRSGTIYMHRIETDPNADKANFIQKQLDTFARTFPADFTSQAFPGRLHCLFSYVDSISEKKIQYHEGEFWKQLTGLRAIPGRELRWNASTHSDLFVQGDRDVAWGAIFALFSSPESLAVPPQ